MNVCDGFVSTEVLLAPLAGSPKFQLKFVMPPVVDPVKVTGLHDGVGNVKSIVPVGVQPLPEHGPAVMLMIFDVELHPFASVTTQ